MLIGVLLLGTIPAHAQERLRQMPGYERYAKTRGQAANAVKRADIRVTWTDGGKGFDYSWDGTQYSYDIAARKATAKGKSLTLAAASVVTTEEFGPSGFPQARARQLTTATSPDNNWKATYKNRNLWLSHADGTMETPITTEGSDKSRVKLGTGCWVYGEELFQRTAMWWSPNSKKIAFYRFDESKIPDFYLQLGQSTIRSNAEIEAYPKSGDPNPVVDVLIYDLDTKQTIRVDVRDGKPFEDSAVGYYVYNARWSPDGKELLFNRTNRRQNAMELAAADPFNGKCRVVVREEWAASWAENSPPIRFLKDNRRFIWESERNGYKNYYLYDLSGKFLATLTDNPFEVMNIVRVDEETGNLFYIARSGDNHMKPQLHRVGLDGKGDIRLTDPAYSHTVNVAPDGKHFIDVAQTHDVAPFTRLVDDKGQVIAELAKSDLTKFDQMGMQKTEVFSYTSADGKTVCYGSVQKPSNFDPAKKYPVIISIYGGPATSGVNETFQASNPMTELGFLVATFDGRNSSGRGKKLLDQLYLHMGVAEVDDFAEGMKVLRKRPYVDGTRVGIEGTSYGGYTSVMCLLRHPDVFTVACASSPVTDWRQYDTIYTERYMWTPQENKEGYDAGSAMTYADKLKGRLMLYYGTADDNVHPNNCMQLIRALRGKGKSFEVQVGPDEGHSFVGQDRMLEFMLENLVLQPSFAKP